MGCCPRRRALAKERLVPWCANSRGRPEQEKAARKRSAELRSGLNHFLAFENSTDIFEFRGDVARRETDLS
jgi:hypothetical protein